ncbi:MAG: hypothetical protein PHF37_04770 [Phycisphaerae bacterium]|nr:hypothetical protein [Phycisphaerae bacterium]
MKFGDCFTIDLKARGEEGTGFRELCGMLFFAPGYRAVVYYRISIYLKKVCFLKGLAQIAGSLILTRLCRVPGVEFRVRNEIGPGLKMFHPHDIVLGAGCEIGRNVTIYNGVTLGAKTLQEMDEEKDVHSRYPKIEDGVVIFTGAKIIGPVAIGENSIVGANSVVMESFPANSIIAGIPARLIGKRQ